MDRNINPVALNLLNAKNPDGSFVIPSPQIVYAIRGVSSSEHRYKRSRQHNLLQHFLGCIRLAPLSRICNRILGGLSGTRYTSDQQDLKSARSLLWHRKLGIIVMELSRYVLEALREDDEFVLYRGKHSNDPHSASVLLLAPASMQPALATLKKIEHEYSLRDELDSDWAVRSLAVSEQRGQMTLLLEAWRRNS